MDKYRNGKWTAFYKALLWSIERSKRFTLHVNIQPFSR